MKKIIVFFISFLSFTAIAQDTLILAEMDTTKTKQIETVSIIKNQVNKLHGSGYYLDAKKIDKLNQTNINNVLRLIPGVMVRDEEGFGLRPNIGLRGTPVNRSSKITIMEDGVLAAPAPYADPSAYYFPTFARMQGIEVLKGSSQIKYGPYTIGGAINLLSTAIPDTFKGQAQISIGNFNTNQQRIWLGNSTQNIDYVLDFNRLASNGFKELDNGGNTGFDRRDVMGKFRWHTAENTTMPQSVVLKFLNTIEDGNESYLGLTYDDFKQNPLRRYAATQKDNLDLKRNEVALSHQIMLPKGISVSTTAYYNNTFRDWARVNNINGVALNTILNDPLSNNTAYLVMTGAANGTINFDGAARAFTAKGIQTNVQYKWEINAAKHQVDFGYRYHEDSADRRSTRDVYNMTDGIMVLASAGINGNRENQVRAGKSNAYYLNYEINYKKLTLNAGVRHENIVLSIANYGNSDTARLGTALQSASNSLDVFLPGIGFNYVVANNMSAFGGVHKGFSPPGTPVTTGNTQANIEKAINYELGYRFAKKSFKTQITGFINAYDNILGSDNVSGGGLGTGDIFNAGKAKVSGIEFQAEYNLLKEIEKSKFKLPLSISYTYTDARFRETFIGSGGDFGTGQINTGDVLPFITPNLFTASLFVEHAKFHAGFTGRYIGETNVKPNAGTNIYPSSNNSFSNINAIKAYYIIDFSANYNINKTFRLFTTVNNVFNNDTIITNLPNGYRSNIPLSMNVGVKADF
jgi:Fe(3+) dicitrate transport protein